MLLVRLGTNNLLVTKCAIYEHRVLSKRPWSPGLASFSSFGLRYQYGYVGFVFLGHCCRNCSSMIRHPSVVHRLRIGMYSVQASRFFWLSMSPLDPMTYELQRATASTSFLSARSRALPITPGSNDAPVPLKHCLSNSPEFATTQTWQTAHMIAMAEITASRL